MTLTLKPFQRYVSLHQAAIYLGMSQKTLYKWAENKAMPGYKLGRVWRFDLSELDTFVRRQKGEPLYNRPECNGALAEGA